MATDLVSAVLAAAAGEIGYREGPNNANKYGVWYGMNYAPWCAIFVSWCFNQAGALKAIPGGKFAGCTPEWTAAIKAGRWTTSNPQPGYIVMLDFNDNRSPDHTGIVEKVLVDGIQTIEGNTGGAGGDGVYGKIRNSHILGYIIPDWAAAGGLAPAPVSAVMLTPTAAAKARPVLKLGHKNVMHLGINIAKDAQTRLIVAGFSCGKAGIDGHIGSDTDKAIRAFQAARNLVPDGAIGQYTWTALGV